MSGIDRKTRPVLGLSSFRDDTGGFTTVAVALALLLSVTLVFSAASAGWVISRSSEVQRVADAAAMAGENVVASYSTVVQVVDSCVLSLGLTGVLVYGAGLVASCVPGLGAVGSQLVAAGGQILETRRGFASSAASGIERLEATLPLLIVACSSSCVQANSGGGVSYKGCAVPFPAQTRSDFSALKNDVDDGEMEGLSEEMREASLAAERAQRLADDALERGWAADCGTSPHCLRERAASLAGMSGPSNPNYPTADSWNFGAALLRAREYYARRLAGEQVSGADGEELTDSACRRAFYEYALSEVRGGSYSELPDGTVSVDLPELPRNTSTTRETRLYDELLWPCTSEDGKRVLHCSLSCPGATGAASGSATLEQLEAGRVSECEECEMSVVELGRVASASTSISNGFEHHWRIIVEASRDYEQAQNELVDAERRTKELAEKGEDSFSEALDELASTRPSVCPPGAWGTVAVVSRDGGEMVPTELTRSFLSSSALPEGVAISGSVLAPDQSDEAVNVLAGFFDSALDGGSALGGALDGAAGLWGGLLEGYGSSYKSVAEVGTDFLESVDGVTGESVGSWLRDRLEAILEGAGLTPVDLRQRKPVLTNSQNVLDKGGLEGVSSARELVDALPDSGSSFEMARALGVRLVNAVGGETLTIAELPLPNGSSLPLTIDLSGLGDAA